MKEPVTLERERSSRVGPPTRRAARPRTTRVPRRAARTRARPGRPSRGRLRRPQAGRRPAARNDASAGTKSRPARSTRCTRCEVEHDELDARGRATTLRDTASAATNPSSPWSSNTAVRSARARGSPRARPRSAGASSASPRACRRRARASRSAHRGERGGARGRGRGRGTRSRRARCSPDRRAWARTPRCRAGRGGRRSTPPETPLFAGIPTETSHSPAPSYMPQVVMTLSTLRTTSSRTARSPVRGLTPPPASVAAMNARSRQSTATEHWRK